jgi:hypothetical protein
MEVVYVSIEGLAQRPCADGMPVAGQHDHVAVVFALDVDVIGVLVDDQMEGEAGVFAHVFELSGQSLHLNTDFVLSCDFAFKRVLINGSRHTVEWVGYAG